MNKITNAISPERIVKWGWIVPALIMGSVIFSLAGDLMTGRATAPAVDQTEAVSFLVDPFPVRLV